MKNGRVLAGLGAMAVTLGVPAGLVLATSAPAQACIFTATRDVSPQCGGGLATVTYDLTAAPSTVATGDPVTLRITASRNGASPVDVTSGTSFSIDAGSCTANVCTPGAAGSRTITARTSSGGTATTQIYAITPDHLAISPPTRTVTAGQTSWYTVYDATAIGVFLDDLTDLATVTLDGTPCPGAVCTATVAGQHTVTATWNGMTAESTLVVEPGPIDSIVVTPHVSNFWNNSAPATFTAEAWDAWGNDVGDVTPQSSFAIAPDGTCTGNTCTPDAGGSHTVTATDGPVSGMVTLDAAGAVPTVAPTLPGGQVGTPYSSSVLSSGDATTWTMANDPSTLPPGLTLGQHGTLSGTPTMAGTYTFFVTAVNDNGGQNEPTTITIAPGTLPSKPTISIGDASVQEGNHGRTAVHVTVTLSAPSSTPVRVAWHTVNGSAVRGKDYYARYGTVTIPAGRTTAQITVYVLGDRKHEGNETFHIVLTRPRGGTLGIARDTVTVVDDD